MTKVQSSWWLYCFLFYLFLLELILLFSFDSACARQLSWCQLTKIFSKMMTNRFFLWPESKLEKLIKTTIKLCEMILDKSVKFKTDFVFDSEDSQSKKSVSEPSLNHPWSLKNQRVFDGAKVQPQNCSKTLKLNWGCELMWGLGGQNGGQIWNLLQILHKILFRRDLPSCFKKFWNNLQRVISKWPLVRSR